jgi:hypothetical protein
MVPFEKPSASAKKIVPLREMTATTFEPPRADEKVPEKRRPSCLSIVSVKATERSSGSFAAVMA